jgi:hypothetical protein
LHALHAGSSQLIFLSVFDRTVAIRCDGVEVQQLLMLAYGHMAASPQDPPDISYRVGPGHGRAGYFVARAGQERLRARDTAEFLFLFEKDLTLELQRCRQDLFFVHAAVVEIHGKSALITAPSGTGKSTTTWGLLHQGFRYLSDELAPINLDAMTVCPYPHALCLKDEPPALYRLPPGTLRTAKTLHIPVACLPARAVQQPVPLVATFILNRDGNVDRTSIQQVNAAEAAARLFTNALNPLAHHGNGLDAAIRIARHTRCFVLNVAELTEACTTLRGMMEELVANRKSGTFDPRVHL